jgi:hypothetical protein
MAAGQAPRCAQAWGCRAHMVPRLQELADPGGGRLCDFYSCFPSPGLGGHASCCLHDLFGRLLHHVRSDWRERGPGKQSWRIKQVSARLRGLADLRRRAPATQLPVRATRPLPVRSAAT